MSQPEHRLPDELLAKAHQSISGNEFGWKKADVLDVIEAARKIRMATIGGQVQYVWPDGTCELYWLSYDRKDRKVDEDWVTFCDRTAIECSNKFKELIKTNIEEDAIRSFEFIRLKQDNGIRLDDHQIFILYFDDQETSQLFMQV